MSNDTERPGVLVTLDAGHGGIVAGKYTTAPAKMYDWGDFVFYEGVWNREIVKQISEEFKEERICHAFTTTTNEDEPLADRIKHLSRYVKAYPNFKHVMLSIHGNAHGIEKANGFEFYTTPGITDSDYAANLFVPYIYDLGMKFRITRESPQEYDKEANFYIIRKAEGLGCIALLFECGFFTNRSDVETMLNPDWQKKLVQVIVNGTKDVIKKLQNNGTIR